MGTTAIKGRYVPRSLVVGAVSALFPFWASAASPAVGSLDYRGDTPIECASLMDRDIIQADPATFTLHLKPGVRVPTPTGGTGEASLRARAGLGPLGTFVMVDSMATSDTYGFLEKLGNGGSQTLVPGMVHGIDMRTRTVSGRSLTGNIPLWGGSGSGLTLRPALLFDCNGNDYSMSGYAKGLEGGFIRASLDSTEKGSHDGSGLGGSLSCSFRGGYRGWSYGIDAENLMGMVFFDSMEYTVMRYDTQGTKFEDPSNNGGMSFGVGSQRKDAGRMPLYPELDLSLARGGFRASADIRPWSAVPFAVSVGMGARMGKGTMAVGLTVSGDTHSAYAEWMTRVGGIRIRKDFRPLAESSTLGLYIVSH